MKNILLLIFIIISVIFAAKKYSSHDAGGGGAGSIVSPYTLQELFDNRATGDSLIIMNTGVYAITTQIDFDAAGPAGTKAAPIEIYAGDASGNIYGGSGTVTLMADASISAILYFAQDFDSYCYFYDIIFDGNDSSDYCINTEAADYHSGHMYMRCRFTNSKSHGIYGYVRGSTSQPWVFLDCEIDSCGGYGYTSPTVNRANVEFYNCSIHNNTSGGAIISVALDESISNIENNRFYKNGGNDLAIYGEGGYVLSGNIFYGSTGSGVYIPGSTPVFNLVINNIFHSCGAYGFNTNSADKDQFVFMDYNCFYNNTTAAIDILSGTPPGTHNKTSDPHFVSTTAGSEDFHLQAGSACIDSGYGY